jgi:ribosomal protein S18 acetylase RimI-like enzyme
VSTDPDALADMAANRGLKLVRSRVRTPGKVGFGLMGLTKATGEAAFGIDSVGKPEASADPVADFLRTGESGDWKASLKAVGGKVRKAPKAASAGMEKPPVPLPKVVPSPPPPPVLREAKAKDADQLVVLFRLLEHDIDAAAVRSNLAALAKADTPILVISEGERIVAACGFVRTLVPHRPAQVGRITILVVAQHRRRQGLGEQLVAEVESRLLALGCVLVEVTSNDRLLPAHSFYRAHGYQRTSMRFAKTLPSG